MYLDGFSKRLTELMEVEMLSNRALSVKIKVDRASIRLWKNGRFFPKYDSLIKLASYFEVGIDSLIGLEEAKKEAEELSVVKAKFCADTQKHFFDQVTGYMQERHLTRYAFAKTLQIDQKAFTNWLKRGSMPETATIIRLANTMRISIDDLLGRKVQ